MKRAPDQSTQGDRSTTGSRRSRAAARKQVGEGSSAPAAPVLRLQGAMGNRAVTGLLARQPTGTQPSSSGSRALQRDSGTPPAKKERVAAFIIRKDNDKYIQDMRDYLATTRKGLAVYEVDNLDDIAAKVKQLTASGDKFDRILIVSHGQHDIGGLGMKLANGKWGFARPDEIKKWAEGPHAADLQGGMASGAEVQVLGCYLGAYHEAGEAIAQAFGATSRASHGQEMVGTSSYTANGKDVTSSANVPKSLKADFEQWLLKTYAALLDAGEAPSLPTDEAKLAYMRDLFDRSKGVIRSLMVEDPNSKQKVAAGSKDGRDLEETQTAPATTTRKTQFDAP